MYIPINIDIYLYVYFSVHICNAPIQNMDNFMWINNEMSKVIYKKKLYACKYIDIKHYLYIYINIPITKKRTIPN